MSRYAIRGCMHRDTLQWVRPIADCQSQRQWIPFEIKDIGFHFDIKVNDNGFHFDIKVNDNGFHFDIKDNDNTMLRWPLWTR